MTQQPFPPQPSAQQPAPVGPPPSTVKLARTLAFALLGWAVIRAILTIALQGTILDSYAENRVAARGDDAFYDYYRNEAAPAFVGQSLLSVLLAVPVVLAALFYLKRARWAQVLATVFGVVLVLAGFVVLAASGAPLWWQLLGVVLGLVALGVVVTLYLSPSRAWFGKRV